MGGGGMRVVERVAVCSHGVTGTRKDCDVFGRRK